MGGHVLDAQRAPAEMFGGAAPWRADRGSDSDYNILTMAISSADLV